MSGGPLGPPAPIPMLTYTFRKLGEAIPVLALASILIFGVVHMLPSDPALVLAGADASEETLDAVRARFGLDQPLPVQYMYWAGNMLRGEFGTSFISRQPVAFLIGQAFPATAELAVATMLVVIMIGIPLGVVAALAEDRPLDQILSGIASFVIGIPNFWLGIVLILVFSVSLGWLPPSGRVPLLQDPGVALRFLILPVATLTPRLSSVLLLFVRSSTLHVLSEDYVRTAKAKGLASARVAFKHVLRNAMIPILTVLSVQFAQLLAGAIVIETVFAWPGIGRLLVQGVRNLDYPLVQALLLLLVTVFIVINVLTDLLYGLTDPRIRVGR